MKATELQVGDWVYYKHSAPKPWEPRKWHIVAFGGGFIELADPDTACKPIPLTAEILEKNGFRTNGTSNEYQLDKDAYTIFYNKKHSLLIIELCGRTCFEYCIVNVHKLQHALRLCGLDELADNFEIE